MKRLALALILITLSISAHAASDEVDKIRSVLAQVVRGEPDSIKPSPLPGMYMAAYGTELVYVSSDGQYLITGDVIDIRRRVSLTEQHRNVVRQEIMTSLDEKSMIVYKAKGETKHIITVFTDIDCPYCVRLHQGMDEMNNLGIEVRYMAYPRAGVGSPTYQKSVNVWCAENRAEAMTRAKSNKTVARADCENPVADHYRAGQKLGVTGTPAILLSDGTLLPGYLPPKRLLQTIEQ